MNNVKRRAWLIIIFICFDLWGCSFNENSINLTPSVVTKYPVISSTEVDEDGIIVTPEGMTQEEIYSEWAHEILEGMTLEEKVAQMFYVRVPETNAIESVQEYQFGGYLLFARDFQGKTKEEVVEIINRYQSHSRLTMFIGVDEEGGSVVRVSKFSEFREKPFLSPQDLFQINGMSTIVEDTTEKSQLLKELGINMNWAPVCDVVTDPSAYMYARAFGQDGKETSEYVSTVVDLMNKNKIGSVLKHFPGYGNNQDTHTGIAIDDRVYDTFVDSDFIPYKAGINAGADMILVSHTIMSCIDSNQPASLSKEVHLLLRNVLHYNGVIISDELSMEAVQQYTKDSDAAVAAVKAGNDMICTTNYEEQIPAVIKAVQENEISIDQIDVSVIRILMLKFKLGLLTSNTFQQ